MTLLYGFAGFAVAFGSKRLTGSFLGIGLVMVAMIGCGHVSHQAVQPAKAEAVDADAGAADNLLRQQVGTRWYAVYDDGLKIGWGKVAKKVRSGLLSSGRRYQIEAVQYLTLLINGYEHQVKRRLLMEFSGTAPFELVRYLSRETINDHKSLKEMVRSGEDYRVTVVNGGLKASEQVRRMDYHLEDALALETWIRQAPSAGDFIYMAYIDPDTLTRAAESARILSVDEASGDAAPLRRYQVKHPAMGWGAIDSVFTGRGELVSCRYAGGFEMQLRTESEARAPISREDLYVRNMLPITATIGRSDEVTRVEFATDNRTGKLLTNGSGQQIMMAPGGDGYRIILDRGDELNEPAFANEIKEAIEVPPALHREGAGLLQSARQALLGIDDKRLLVERLLNFVDEAVEDSNEIISPNLAYSLDKRKGDCSEHAAVFEALARAFEIPCRTVSGLVYMGDWSQSFGLHAWNEVVLDDYWQPVDVTRRAVDLPPFYIRFPFEAQQREKLFHHLSQMHLKVLKVEKAPSP